MTEDLPRSAPADQRVDPAAVLAFVDAVDADPAIELHSLMVVRNGQVVAEGWWAPHTPERTRLLYSLSKSFTSTALGLALEEGRFLVETDAPYLGPDRERRNEPTTTVRVVAELARLRGTAPHELVAPIRGAFERLIG